MTTGGSAVIKPKFISFTKAFIIFRKYNIMTGNLMSIKNMNNMYSINIRNG